MMRDVTVWADLSCGCSVSDDRWWVVAGVCRDHRYMIPPGLGVWKRKPRDYGPFRLSEAELLQVAEQLRAEDVAGLSGVHLQAVPA